MSEHKLEDFEQFRVHQGRSIFKGEQKDNGQSYHDITWIVDGTGRCISAMILVGDKIAKHKIWHYDSIYEWKRKQNHKKMMLEALIWACY